jgi:glucose-6-phosphate-specific signal transduction histidine kinase
MTTFTLQDLNTSNINNLPTTPEEDEAMKELFEKMGQDLTAQHAPTPQPSGENPHNIGDIINTICTQLQLLATVINQPKAQPEGAQESLQETVALVLQQSDWFKSLLRETIVDEISLEDVVKDVVKDEVESAVESYFSNEFDPTYHFDFNDAVSSEVSDQLDDVVRDRLDEVVQEQLEEVVAEKLKSIRVVFD